MSGKIIGTRVSSRGGEVFHFDQVLTEEERRCFLRYFLKRNETPHYVPKPMDPKSINLWLDASIEESIDFDEHGNVKAWRDRRSWVVRWRRLVRWPGKVWRRWRGKE
jgi:hypothetical protein